MWVASMIFKFTWLLAFFLWISFSNGKAAAEPGIQGSNELNGETEAAQPAWEFGMGAGYVRYEQYPAAGQFNHLFLPFPTFQYRGRILRADDRDGAKAYLWVYGPWTLEISGTGSLGLDSDDNELRKGMDDLPWLFAFGPELVLNIRSDLELSWGLFQASATDLKETQFSGVFLESKLAFINESHWDSGLRSVTKYSAKLKSASREIQNHYYEVKVPDATPTRPAYYAKAGFLSTELSIFQTLKKNRYAFYAGINYSDYGLAQNRKSPLHKAEDQVSYLFGLTYIIGESKKPELPPKKGSGFLDGKSKSK